MRLSKLLPICAALACICVCTLNAATLVTVAIDENGNGSYTINGVTTPLSFSLAQDPGPGGLANVLIYSGLPVQGVQGDLHLTENGIFLDVIRWNGNGTIAFYSDNVDGVDALADTPRPPLSSYTNLLSIPEVGPEGNNGATYHPSAGNPGFGSTDFDVTYIITSDSVPEPGSASLLLLATGALVAFRRWRTRPSV